MAYILVWKDLMDHGLLRNYTWRTSKNNKNNKGGFVVMIILGLNYTTHDAAASIIKDGKVVAAIEEERLNREKHTKKFPELAIRECLKIADICLDDVDRIALFTNPKNYYKLGLYNLFGGFPKSVWYFPYAFKWMIRRYQMKNILNSTYKNIKLPSTTYINHHDAHAASSFYPSPFKSAAIITCDGRGEYETICIYRGKNYSLKKLYSIKYPHSIGYLYSMVTKYLGFKPQSDEYKVMGLSAYGKPTYCDKFSDIANFNSRNKFKLNLSYFDHHYKYGKRRLKYSQKFINTFGLPRTLNQKILQQHKDVAYALQDLTEKLIYQLVEIAFQLTNEKNLCFAGGVALNCVANSKILKQGLFNKIYIQPAANDAGCSLGAAIYSYYHLLNMNKGARNYLQDVYLGPSFTSDEIKETIEKFNHKIISKKIESPAKLGAEFIYDKKVIGWFQGRMEFGPRALGNRSIIASPADKEMKDLINLKVKFREEFRPFAPSVLEEYANNYFEYIKSGNLLYPYMLATLKVKEEKLNHIPAVVHIDNSSRLQIVSKEFNPLYYELIKNYHQFSGIPVVLNTSFNIKGEPIVCTPEDAIKTYLNSELDYLIIGNYLIEKN